MTNTDERYNCALNLYNKLEELFKTSQIAQKFFEIPVLNEYRYISRALVDYNLTMEIELKEKAISKLEVGIAAAYNDIMDSIVLAIKSSIQGLKNNFPNVNASNILEKFEYKKVAEAIVLAEQTIVDSRGDRISRLDKYYEFSAKDEYKLLINFCTYLNLIEYLFDIESNQTVSDSEKNIFESVYKAFENPTGTYPHFELHYQPKYDNKKCMIGAEALIRLRVTENDLIPPGAFLEAIHQARLENKLDRWVLETTAKDLNEFKDLLPSNFDIAINVNPSTISDYEYISIFNTTIRENAIEDILSIEIIENWNEENGDHIQAHYRLAELNEKTKIAIDDFGTGTTMLEYIVMISNLNTIKIDKILIDKLETKNKEKALKLISGITKLAEESGLKVTAEGIETDRQFEMLSEIGIDFYQGFKLSYPLTLNDFIQKINS
ncbi:EAL domain-containing protein [Poseidonibacter lekithochrous]|uniref:EAL domain-containing protein n=1 Tax=Poseidonibacter lekithochrous TaxID=1904463 RepID=UPI0008FC977C|nr:EAL domain-containing protein [Poseidonibacter lekithochrous]QKJ21526.1 diguanylate phosphodiesterase [Poseidonibacter lekithochrous]